jgi:predicted TIM-barrel enzyme
MDIINSLQSKAIIGMVHVKALPELPATKPQSARSFSMPVQKLSSTKTMV